MTKQATHTDPKNWHLNAEIMNNKFAGKNRVNVEIMLLNELKVRREVDYVWFKDPYGLVVDAVVLGDPLPFEAYELEMDIKHHIEECELLKIIDLTIKHSR